MTFRSRSRRSAALPLLAAGAALALTLVGCSATPEAPPEPKKLSASQAGGAYLQAVCPVNDAWGEADVEIDRLRLALERGDADPKDAQQALTAVGAASAKAAKELDPQTSEWPKAAAPSVEEVRQSLISDQKQVKKVAKLSAKELAVYRWEGAEASGKSSAAARAALGLPEDPAFACSEWAAQQDRPKETKKEAEEHGN